jgi:hypothetical protein
MGVSADTVLGREVKFVFLFYLSRSGSTLVAKEIADRLPEVLVFPEFRLPEFLIAEGDDRVRGMSQVQIRNLIASDPQFENLGFAEEEVERIAATAGGSIGDIMEAVASCHAEKHGRSPSVVLIKHGGLLRLTGSLHEIFPGCQFIHIVRDVRGVVNSSLRSKRPYTKGESMGRGDCVHVAKSWLRYLAEFDRVCAAGDGNALEISFEEFCTAPGRAIEEIKDFTGVREESGPTQLPSYFRVGARESAIHELIHQPPLPERVSAWKNELPRWKGIAVEMRVGPRLLDKGYQIFFSGTATQTEKVYACVKAHVVHLYATARFWIREARRLLFNWRLLSLAARLAVRRRLAG